MEISSFFPYSLADESPERLYKAEVCRYSSDAFDSDTQKEFLE